MYAPKDLVGLGCSPLAMELILWIPRDTIVCPTISHSLHIWDTSCRRWPLRSAHTPVAPLFGNPLFPPVIHPDRFGWWVNKGLYCKGDFLDHRGIRPSSHFVDSLEMPPMENFHLQQILHFLNSIQKGGADLTVRAMFENRCVQGAALWGGISMLYRLLFSPPS